MRNAEKVTFGGSGLDRAAQFRGDGAALQNLFQKDGARVLIMWRGKPLVGPEGLCLLRPGHALLAGFDPRTDVFLGLGERQGADAATHGVWAHGVWAHDLSDWQPPEDQAPQPGFLDPTEQYHPEAPPGAVFRELRAIMAHLSPREAELTATARAILEWHRTHGFCATCGAKSDIAQSGWQRDCPDCGRHHFPRTDPVVIMLVLSGNDVLLGRSPGWPDGMYSLLAGFVEPGETIEAAVRRETLEESGIVVGEVGYLASQPWAFPASLMLGCIGNATSRDITVDPAELDDALWVSRERMMSVMAGQDPQIRPARQGAIAHFLVARWLADTLD